MQNAAMNIQPNSVHVSVMKSEIGQYLKPEPKGVYLDATLGFGGHTLELLERTGYKARVICFDVDSEALVMTSEMLSQYKDRLDFVNRNFSEISTVLEEYGIEAVDGIVADLGLSSYQLEHSGRGFSFQKDEQLDMRADSAADLTASEIVNNYSQAKLA